MRKLSAILEAGRELMNWVIWLLKAVLIAVFTASAIGLSGWVMFEIYMLLLLELLLFEVLLSY